MQDVQSILKKHWGYEAFRPLQKEIIESVLAGRDTLAVLPTGGGKSICFQVPALAQEGICIVVSPLIALMKDQVENLKKRSIPALLIHSGMQRADVVKTLQNATNSYFKFLYVSPERLETSLFKEYLPSFDVNLIAVDEAHCISQWGYDFRPSYLRIATLRKELPNVPVLALTASATPQVRLDICDKLQIHLQKAASSKKDLERWAVYTQSFKRSNLSYSSFKVDSKMVKLTAILKSVAGPAIVYCKSRRRTQEIAALLQMHGLGATNYHAGLSADERSKRQQSWIENKTRVIVCTNAFGMGIDKPDVRTVIHIDAPDSIENYYQEAGRSGRDGKKAYTVLLHDEKDVQELSVQHLTRFPTLDQIKSVYQSLVNFLQIPVYSGQDRSFTFHFDEFISNFKLQGAETLYALKALESDGWLDFNEKNYAPSMLVFSTYKAGLYAFEESYPQHEPLLTTLLRTYGGIFDYQAFISEKTIARLMRLTEDEVQQQLKTIAAFGIIQYMPQNSDPQIIFRKNRVPAEELTIDLKAYHKRRDAYVSRANAMIAYIQTNDCRSRFISHYFGEENATDCGVCDNCLRRKNRSLTTTEFENISAAILAQVSTNHTSIEKLLTHLSKVPREKAWKVIEFLQAEKKIRVDDSGNLFTL